MPIFPLIFHEKALALKYNGDLAAAKRKDKTSFKPNLAEQTSIAVLETAYNISQSLERQLGQISKKRREEITMQGAGCGKKWLLYCGRIQTAIDYVIGNNKKVIVVTQPYISDGHIEQQQALKAMLEERYSNHQGLKYVNLGNTLNLKNREFAYDGMHLTAKGNFMIAENITQTVFEIIE